MRRYRSNRDADGPFCGDRKRWRHFQDHKRQFSWSAASTNLPASTSVNVLAIKTLCRRPLSTLGPKAAVCSRAQTAGGIGTRKYRLINLYIIALATDPVTPGTLYAGAADGLFKSTNDGGTGAR